MHGVYPMRIFQCFFNLHRFNTRDEWVMFTKVGQTSFRMSNSPCLDIIKDLFDEMISRNSCSNSRELLFGSGWNFLFIILFFLLSFFIVGVVVLLWRWRRRLMRFILVYFLVFFVLVCPTCGCFRINSWFTLSWSRSFHLDERGTLLHLRWMNLANRQVLDCFQRIFVTYINWKLLYLRPLDSSNFTSAISSTFRVKLL